MKKIPSKEVTEKEQVYYHIKALEVKLDLMMSGDTFAKKYFRKMVYIIIFLEIMNIVIHALSLINYG
jgi:hypothetical protein